MINTIFESIKHRALTVTTDSFIIITIPVEWHLTHCTGALLFIRYIHLDDMYISTPARGACVAAVKTIRNAV